MLAAWCELREDFRHFRADRIVACHETGNSFAGQAPRLRRDWHAGDRRGPWRHCEAVELVTLQWVHWYNHRRRFEPLGHVPPAEFETHYDHQLRESAMAA